MRTSNLYGEFIERKFRGPKKHRVSNQKMQPALLAVCRAPSFVFAENVQQARRVLENNTQTCPCIRARLFMFRIAPGACVLFSRFGVVIDRRMLVDCQPATVQGDGVPAPLDVFCGLLDDIDRQTDRQADRQTGSPKYRQDDRKT